MSQNSVGNSVGFLVEPSNWAPESCGSSRTETGSADPQWMIQTETFSINRMTWTGPKLQNYCSAFVSVRCSGKGSREPSAADAYAAAAKRKIGKGKGPLRKKRERSHDRSSIHAQGAGLQIIRFIAWVLSLINALSHVLLSQQGNHRTKTGCVIQSWELFCCKFAE